MRVYDWDPIGAEHYGQRLQLPHKQAGHVTAPDQCCRYVRKFLPRRRPHVTQSGHRHFTYYDAFASACRPRSVMMYSVFRSLCRCFITYCASTRRMSPTIEAAALTMRPRSPAARNALRNQISSLVKSMVIRGLVVQSNHWALEYLGSHFR